MPARFKPNKSEKLKDAVYPDGINWVTENTAILIAHGIGNQLPLETLDHFGRGLIKQFKAQFDDDLCLSHQIIAKPIESGGFWFDNVLRLEKKGSDHYIDLYEFYWANYTEDKASWKDINKWLQGMVKGANSFYKKNAQLGKQYKDKSPFFDSETGDFKVGVYRFFMATMSRLFLFIDMVWRLMIWLVSLIPFLGNVADAMLKNYAEGIVHDITNIVGDIVVYNITDPKSKFYPVKSKILNNAVKAIQYLLEKTTNDDLDIPQLEKDVKEGRRTQTDLEEQLKKEKLRYRSVIIAGHSLGTQVCYDAINKIDFLINENKIQTYNGDGTCRLSDKIKISQQLNGFITFGSPLDKIIFFLRENIPDEEYLRQQFLNNFHNFKLRDLDSRFNNIHTNKLFVPISCKLQQLLKSVNWRNYYDGKDYVSGGLDYYEGLTNIDCGFKAGKFAFTHSYYWDDDEFYMNIIYNYLSK